MSKYTNGLCWGINHYVANSRPGILKLKTGKRYNRGGGFPGWGW